MLVGSTFTPEDLLDFRGFLAFGNSRVSKFQGKSMVNIVSGGAETKIVYWDLGVHRLGCEGKVSPQVTSIQKGCCSPLFRTVSAGRIYRHSKPWVSRLRSSAGLGWSQTKTSRETSSTGICNRRPDASEISPKDLPNCDFAS